MILEREERGRERKRQRETLMWDINIIWLPPIHTPAGDQTGNLSMCPDQDSNPQPLGTWKDAPANWDT